jgi:hypothetical protein
MEDGAGKRDTGWPALMAHEETAMFSCRVHAALALLYRICPLAGRIAWAVGGTAVGAG